MHFGGGVSGHIKLVPKFLQWVKDGYKVYTDTSWAIGFGARWLLVEIEKQGVGGDRVFFGSDEPWSDFMSEYWKIEGVRGSRRSSRSGSSWQNYEKLHEGPGEHAPCRSTTGGSLVELQSLGVRVEDETGGARAGARGGAGPSDAGFLWMRGLPLTVPMHADYVAHSPYELRLGARGARADATATRSAPVALHPRPRSTTSRRPTGCPTGRSP